jgi:hypothetical protein
MARTFIPEPEAAPEASAQTVDVTAEIATESTPDAAAEPSEFEFVLGRRQVASVALVIISGLAAATGGAYFVGKSSAAPIPQVAAPAPKPAPAPPVAEPAPKPTAPAPAVELPLATSNAATRP